MKVYVKVKASEELPNRKEDWYHVWRIEYSPLKGTAKQIQQLGKYLSYFDGKFLEPDVEYWLKEIELPDEELQDEAINRYGSYGPIAHLERETERRNIFIDGANFILNDLK